MATELLRTPLVQKKRPRLAHEAMASASLLMLFSLAVFFDSSVAVVTGSPELVELTLVPGAREKGAVCLDGSPPAYHLQRGFGSGSHSWLVYLQGGAWCNTAESCSERKMTDLGSSHLMEAVEFDGILSNKHPQNPDFYDWNKVVIRYCDGASFAGDAEGEDQVIVLDLFFVRKTRQELSLGVKMVTEIPALRGMFPKKIDYRKQQKWHGKQKKDLVGKKNKNDRAKFQPNYRNTVLAWNFLWKFSNF